MPDESGFVHLEGIQNCQQIFHRLREIKEGRARFTVAPHVPEEHSVSPFNSQFWGHGPFLMVNEGPVGKDQQGSGLSAAQPVMQGAAG
ncbi:hypothetical protein SDC9_184329 [bioreactor metagenome]|uniref:Uncharacterized protein n=1 Tax=bioreactor metagenome TaxID=1076179 RepID=A0A645HCQ9_9ZZZZ